MKESEILKRIYPSVVTYKGDWQKMIRDVSRLKLKEISLFLTGATILERKKIYQALLASLVKIIPHVHIRHDFKETEFDFLVSQYKTRVFTTHSQYFKRFARLKHRRKIFIESNDGRHQIKKLSVLKQVGGVCIDLAHLEQFRLGQPVEYKISCQAAKKYKVGCNHVSAVLSNGKSWHHVEKLSQLDYLKGIPLYFFSPYINLELRNSIVEQLRFKKYIAKILAKQWNKKHVLR